MISEGTKLKDRYILCCSIGEGGMGEVWRAADCKYPGSKDVAIKFLHESLCGRETSRKRFMREARAAFTAGHDSQSVSEEEFTLPDLSHPGIVDVYDFGEFEGRPFIVMEYVNGISLKKYVKKLKPSAERILYLITQVCDALEHAHRQKIIHRDLKPDNIFVCPPSGNGKEKQEIKILDFGLARFKDDTDMSPLTRPGTTLGTCSYMSPEQARGQLADERSDLYSLGIILYELFCGSVPFSAEAPASVLYMQVHDEPTPPCQANPKLPKEIGALISWLLNKNPKYRPQTALHLKARINQLIYMLRTGAVGHPSSADSQAHNSGNSELRQSKREQTAALPKNHTDRAANPRNAFAESAAPPATLATTEIFPMPDNLKRNTAEGSDASDTREWHTKENKLGIIDYISAQNEASASNPENDFPESSVYSEPDFGSDTIPQPWFRLENGGLIYSKDNLRQSLWVTVLVMRMPVLDSLYGKSSHIAEFSQLDSRNVGDELDRLIENNYNAIRSAAEVNGGLVMELGLDIAKDRGREIKQLYAKIALLDRYAGLRAVQTVKKTRQSLQELGEKYGCAEYPSVSAGIYTDTDPQARGLASGSLNTETLKEQIAGAKRLADLSVTKYRGNKTLLCAHSADADLRSYYAVKPAGTIGISNRNGNLNLYTIIDQSRSIS